MNKFKKWIKSEFGSYAAAARALGMSESKLSKVMIGNRRLTQYEALKIENMSGGKVKAVSLRKDAVL
jgi:DNA-binding transcriptional regulator YdaS (Cro superfamily)